MAADKEISPDAAAAAVLSELGGIFTKVKHKTGTERFLIWFWFPDWLWLEFH